MTPEQTRQLGIEFERRVQTMIPEKEFIDKLDTETIYSYLNQYQDKLIHDLYRTVDQIPTSNNETYIETLLNSMLKSVEIFPQPHLEFYKYNLPEDFGLYLKSYTNVGCSYKYKGDIYSQMDFENGKGVIPNEIISAKDVNKVIQRPQDNMRILRNPLVWLIDEHGLGAMYDRYTHPVSIFLEYYRIPNYMNPLTSTVCELPMEMFEQLVSGAVDLYVQYVAGAEARKRQLAEQQRQQQKRNNDEE